MTKLDKLNPRARKIAARLFEAFPGFRKRFEVIGKGDLRAVLLAPKGSNTRGVRVTTRGRGDIFIQFSKPNAFCFVDNARELISILKGLMSDRLRLTTIDRNGRWALTFLLRPKEIVYLKQGDDCRVYSWSGNKDETRTPNQSTDPAA
jgi:hypothetical protein